MKAPDPKALSLTAQERDALLCAIAQLKQENRHLAGRLHHREEMLRLLYASASFRLGNTLLGPLRKGYQILTDRLALHRSQATPPTDPTPPLGASSLDAERQRNTDAAPLIRAELALLDRPSVSVILDARQATPQALAASLDSLAHQVAPDWEVCLLTDAGASPDLAGLCPPLAERPERCRVLEQKPGAAPGVLALNAAAAQTGGDWLIFLEAGDRLAPDALLGLARLLHETPEANLVYGDEDRLLPDGGLGEAFFKPDHSPERLINQNYIGPAFFIRRATFTALGGFSPDLEPAHGYDLLLRAEETAPAFGHLAQVILHRAESARPPGEDADRKAGAAIQQALTRRGEEAQVQPGPAAGLYRVRYRLKPGHKVSLLIPSNGNLTYLKPCIEGLKTYRNSTPLQVVVILNNIREPGAFAYLESQSADLDLIVCEHDIPFNFARLINYGASRAGGDYLLVYNDDVVPSHKGWLDAMMEQGQREPVGAVGAKLLFPDGRIQHAGVVLGMGGTCTHVFRLAPGNASGYFHNLDVVANLSAVTGACLLVRRERFEQVAGMNPEFATDFNDIDFCLRLAERGWRTVLTPHARLVHHESVSRGSPLATEQSRLHFTKETRLFLERWKPLVMNDPCFNRNLSLRDPNVRPKTLLDLGFESLWWAEEREPE